MRIRSITPIAVGAAELERRQARYDRLAPEGVTVALEDLPAETDPPTQLATEDDIRRSERIGLELARATSGDDADAVMPDCVLDPAVSELDAGAVPVLGITRLTAHLLAGFGVRFGVVTRNRAIGDEYRRVIERYGLAAWFDDVYVLGLSVEDIADDAKWNAAITAAAAEAKAKGVTVLVNGCSAVEVTVEQDVRVIDPTALALKLAALGAETAIVGSGR